MPIYSYKSPTGKIVDIFQHMNELHEYEEDGVKFKRVFYVPNAQFDSVIKDPYSQTEFVEKSHKKMTMKDFWDKSGELSAKRAAKEGKDPVREQFYKDYAAQRHGTKHPEQVREEGREKLEKLGAKVKFRQKR